MSKSLGYGYIKETGHRTFIEDAESGKLVDLPWEAFSFNPNRANEDPRIGERFLYTGTQNDTRIRADSACRPADLKLFEGTIVQLDLIHKYAHVKPKNGSQLIFTPFSARSKYCKAWHGTDAELNKHYSVMAFRQPESHGCTHVAWSILEGSQKANLTHPLYMDVENKALRKSDHQSVEYVTNQLGIIYSISNDNVVLVTSPTCQDASFAPNFYADWMKPGRFVNFDGRRVNDTKTGKLMGSNPIDCGTIFPYDNMEPLIINVDAILCRVDDKQVIAWNDLIGRIFIPPSLCDRKTRLLPFAAANMTVSYIGKHENTPWVACSIFPYNSVDTEQMLEKYANMLITEDNWKVFSVIDGPENPSYFLTKFDDKGHKVNAFAKKIDINQGEYITANTPVRVTYYAQKRHHKHAMRAVLVTPLEKVDKNPKIHRHYTGSGVIFMPEPFEPATERPKPAPAPPAPKILPAPLPKKNCWNMKNLGSPTPAPAPTPVEEKTPVAPIKKPEPMSIMSPLPVIPAIGQELQNRQSMWSGTPVESKQSPVSFFAFEPLSFLTKGNALPELSISENSDGSTSQPSTTSTSGPIGDHRNSLSSSPELPMDPDQTLAALQDDYAPNAWASLNVDPTVNRGTSVNSDHVSTGSLSGTSNFQSMFSIGFPRMDLPIYSQIQPTDFNEVLMPKKPLRSASTSFPFTCCESRELLLDLFENPNFVAAFSKSEPQKFRMAEAKLKMSRMYPQSSTNNNKY